MEQRKQFEEPGPRVVNFNDFGSKEELDKAFGDQWRYIGREVSEYGMPASPLGNPFTVEEYGREVAVEKYRQWLFGELRSAGAVSTSVLDALLEINEDSVLVCWCAPKSCHGNVVRAAWFWWHEHN